MSQAIRFLRDTDGAVTIEWVALSAGVIVLALGVVTILADPLTGVSGSIASTIVTVTSDLLDKAG